MCYDSVTELFGTPLISPGYPRVALHLQNHCANCGSNRYIQIKEHFPGNPRLKNSVRKAASHHREKIWNSPPPIVSGRCDYLRYLHMQPTTWRCLQCLPYVPRTHATREGFFVRRQCIRLLFPNVDSETSWLLLLIL